MPGVHGALYMRGLRAGGPESSAVAVDVAKLKRGEQHPQPRCSGRCRRGALRGNSGDEPYAVVHVDLRRVARSGVQKIMSVSESALNFPETDESRRPESFRKK